MTMQHRDISGITLRAASTALILVLVLAVLPVQSQAQTYKETVLHVFAGGGDGFLPEARLMIDSAGNLYGTTVAGGAFNVGTVFKVDTSGNETILYTFNLSPYGTNPATRLVMDKAGSLYGTTGNGGAFGFGTVFKVDTSGNETVLHHFAGGKDGEFPEAGLILSRAGNFYGTTTQGGDPQACNQSGCGTVFTLDRNGKYTVLYRFTGGARDGASPQGDLVRDSKGNLYGTTIAGGSTNMGTVFKVLARKETLLYSFVGGTDGASPIAGLLRDRAGNLYGTTELGGDSSCPLQQGGCGTVFKIDRRGHETVLHAFTGGADGAVPIARLVKDTRGNLYGTTVFGGTGCPKSKILGCGTAFKLDRSNTKTVLYNFKGNGGDGREPYGGLAIDSAGNLCGTTTEGGGRKCRNNQIHGCGTVFKLTP